MRALGCAANCSASCEPRLLAPIRASTTVLLASAARARLSPVRRAPAAVPATKVRRFIESIACTPLGLVGCGVPIAPSRTGSLDNLLHGHRLTAAEALIGR